MSKSEIGFRFTETVVATSVAASASHASSIELRLSQNALSARPDSPPSLAKLWTWQTCLTVMLNLTVQCVSAFLDRFWTLPKCLSATR